MVKDFCDKEHIGQVCVYRLLAEEVEHQQEWQFETLHVQLRPCLVAK